MLSTKTYAGLRKTYAGLRARARCGLRADSTGAPTGPTDAGDPGGALGRRAAAGGCP